MKTAKLIIITLISLFILNGCDEEGNLLTDLEFEGFGALEVTVNIPAEITSRSDLSVDISTKKENLVFEELYFIATLINEDGTTAGKIKDVPLSDYISKEVFDNGGSEPILIENVPNGTWMLEFSIVSRKEMLDDVLLHSQQETVTIEINEATQLTLDLTFTTPTTTNVPMTINLMNMPDGVTRIKIYSRIVDSKDISTLKYPDISDRTINWLVDYIKTDDNSTAIADNYALTTNILPASEDPGTINYVTIQAIHNNGIKDIVLFQGNGTITVTKTTSNQVPYVLDMIGFEFAYKGTNIPISGIHFSIVTSEGSEYTASNEDIGAEYKNMVHIPYELGNFYMDETEVTIKSFNYLMSLYYPNFIPRDEGESGENSLYPISNMTIFDAILYCNAKSMYNDLTPVYTYDVTPTNPKWENGECVMLDYVETENTNGFRIPKKEEWIAALTDFDGFTSIEEFAHLNAGPEAEYLNVASKLPNSLGLYDIIGSARELVLQGDGVTTGYLGAGWCYASVLNDEGFMSFLGTAPYGGATKDNIFFYYVINNEFKEIYTGFRCVATVPIVEE